MPVHSENRQCKNCLKSFDVLVKRGRPHAFCADCRKSKKANNPA